MALNNPNTNAKFESQDETDNLGQATVGVNDAPVKLNAGEVASATDSTAQSTAIAVAKTSALAVAAPTDRQKALQQANILGTLRNAMPVTWEDFTAINANQGQFQIKGGETAKPIGSEIGLLLVSYQDQWVSAPKDNDAEGDDMVRYSDDGVNLNDGSGRTLKEHQESLAAAGEEPTMSHRLVLVGELLSCGEAGMDEVGNLVQVILAESGRRNFQSHEKQVAYQLLNGRMKQGDAERIKLTATQAGTGKKQYTLVKVSYADGHGPVKG